ncbi:MAG: hypothetical protein ACHQHN_17805, partial [Sphingobacteriales bacterium]
MRIIPALIIASAKMLIYFLPTKRPDGDDSVWDSRCGQYHKFTRRSYRTLYFGNIIFYQPDVPMGRSN